MSKIHESMIAVMRQATVIGKDKYNKEQRYNFRGVDDVYNHLHVLMAEHGIYMTSKVLSRDRHEKTTKSGGVLLYTIAEIEYTFHADDGSSVTTSTIGEGMDSGDKGSSKAMSVAHKYALLQAFLIPTEEMARLEAETHELGAGVVSAEQAANIEALADEVNADLAAFLKWIGAETIAQIPAVKYPLAIAALEKKRKAA